MSQYPPTPPPYNAPRDHPQTTTILILGILGLAVCQVLGPFAWSMGNKALREIDASNGQLGGRDTTNVGRILGIVATVILGVAVGSIVIVFAFAIYSASV
jgi:multisubunit Na+/H+ antiporter MnhB subunit